MTQTLAEKFGFEVRADVAKMLLDSVPAVPTNVSPDKRASMLRSRQSNHTVAALDYYLLGMLAETRKVAVQIPAITLDWLFGSWRTEFVSESGEKGHEALRASMSWMGGFEGSLLWGATLGEWEFLEKIAEYPSEDADIGYEGFDETDRLVFLAISSLLLNDQNRLSRYLNDLNENGGERSKHVAAVLDGMSQRDVARLNDALGKYLQYFKKREFPKRNIFRKVSVLGTFVYHYGHHLGLAVHVEPEFMDHIVRLS